MIFYIKGKKNNQTSVSDADRENPTLVSTDNLRKTINLVSGIIRLPSGWDFSVCDDFIYILYLYIYFMYFLPFKLLFILTRSSRVVYAALPAT